MPRALPARALPAMPASPSTLWLTLRRRYPNTRAKVRTSVRVRADARAEAAQAKTPAKPREVAQPTEASRLNSSNQALAAHIWAGLGRFRQGGTASALCRASGRSGDSSFGQSLVCCGCRAFGGLDG